MQDYNQTDWPYDGPDEVNNKRLHSRGLPPHFKNWYELYNVLIEQKSISFDASACGEYDDNLYLRGVYDNVYYTWRVGTIKARAFDYIFQRIPSKHDMHGFIYKARFANSVIDENDEKIYNDLLDIAK